MDSLTLLLIMTGALLVVQLAFVATMLKYSHTLFNILIEAVTGNSDIHLGLWKTAQSAQDTNIGNTASLLRISDHLIELIQYMQVEKQNKEPLDPCYGKEVKSPYDTTDHSEQCPCDVCTLARKMIDEALDKDLP